MHATMAYVTYIVITLHYKLHYSNVVPGQGQEMQKVRTTKRTAQQTKLTNSNATRNRTTNSVALELVSE